MHYPRGPGADLAFKNGQNNANGRLSGPPSVELMPTNRSSLAQRYTTAQAQRRQGQPQQRQRGRFGYSVDDARAVQRLDSGDASACGPLNASL